MNGVHIEKKQLTMKQHRFLIDVPLKKGTLSVTSKEQIHQIVSVLRLTKDDDIILVYNGEEGIARIQEIGENHITLSVHEITSCPVPSRDVYLACSLLRKDNVEWIVQKATEIGVKGIIPFISKRTVKTNIATKRLEKIIKEAVEQSGWGRVPVLYDVKTFTDVLDTLTDVCDVLYLADNKTHKSSSIQGASCGVIVGPEGGLSEEEIAYAYQKGAQPLSLGNSTLRGETAAILSVYHVLYWKE